MDAPKGVVCGLFSSSVHTQQTTVERSKGAERADEASGFHRRRMEAIERLEAGSAPAAEPPCIAFRHSGWWSDRQRVAAALERCGVPRARRERFAVCGSDAVVECDPATGMTRLRAFYCGDRCCRACCNARR